MFYQWNYCKLYSASPFVTWNRQLAETIIKSAFPLKDMVNATYIEKRGVLMFLLHFVE